MQNKYFWEALLHFNCRLIQQEIRLFSVILNLAALNQSRTCQDSEKSATKLNVMEVIWVDFRHLWRNRDFCYHFCKWNVVHGLLKLDVNPSKFSHFFIQFNFITPHLCNVVGFWNSCFAMSKNFSKYLSDRPRPDPPVSRLMK